MTLQLDEATASERLGGSMQTMAAKIVCFHAEPCARSSRSARAPGVCADWRVGLAPSLDRNAGCQAPPGRSRSPAVVWHVQARGLWLGAPEAGSHVAPRSTRRARWLAPCSPAEGGASTGRVTGTCLVAAEGGFNHITARPKNPKQTNTKQQPQKPHKNPGQSHRENQYGLLVSPGVGTRQAMGP